MNKVQHGESRTLFDCHEVGKSFSRLVVEARGICRILNNKAFQTFFLLMTNPTVFEVERIIDAGS